MVDSKLFCVKCDPMSKNILLLQLRGTCKFRGGYLMIITLIWHKSLRSPSLHASGAGLVSCLCYSKLPQRSWLKTPPTHSIPILDGRSPAGLSGANEGIHKTYLFRKLQSKTSFLPFHALKDVCILLLMAHGLAIIESHHCCPITHLSDLSMTVSVIWRAHVIRLAPSLLSKIISTT